jgi:hypothetical protein
MQVLIILEDPGFTFLLLFSAKRKATGLWMVSPLRTVFEPSAMGGVLWFVGLKML